MSEERRKQPRHDSLNLAYLCEDEDGAIVQEGMGRTLNVSEGGILLETHFPMGIGRSIIVQIALEDDLIGLRGRVAHCRQQTEGLFHSGVEFAEIPARERDTLRRFIVFFTGRPSAT